MALNRRQQLAYTWTMSLYKPSDPVANTIGGGKDQAYTLSQAGVKMMYCGTENFYEPEVAGATKITNIMTSDKFHADAALATATGLNYGWAMKLTATDPAGEPQIGTWWYVQGLPQVVPASGRRAANYCKVYGVIGPAPSGLS